MNENFWSVELGRGMGPLDLGLDRETLLQRLQEADVEVEADDDEPHIYGGNGDFILTLAELPPAALLQIAADDERVHFGSQQVVNRRLHEITELLQVQSEETIWRTDDDPDQSLPTGSPAELKSTSDEELLQAGTLWIKPLGLGLRLWQGEIDEIYLRAPGDVPSIGLGPLTPQQVELSKQADLADRLRAASGLSTKPRGCFRPLTTFACFALIAWTVWEAAKYQKRLHDAPTVTATVIEVRPDDPETIPTEFIVAYRDAQGAEQRVPLTLADVYVPQKVGDEVELRYFPNRPSQVFPPGRVKDAAFIKYFPRGIAVLAGWLVLQIVASIVGKLFKPAATSGSSSP